MMPRSFATALVLALVSSLVEDRSVRAAATYAADASHSSVIYRVKHMNTSFSWGRFNDVSGSFSIDEANPTESRFEFQVKSDSIDSGNDKRDQHLKGPDFFNAVQFPTIAFKSQSVTKSANGYEVSGDLTLHGVTKPVTVRLVPAGSGKSPMGKAIAGIEANFNIKRSDFGMKAIPGIGDDVLLYVSVE